MQYELTKSTWLDVVPCPNKNTKIILAILPTNTSACIILTHSTILHCKCSILDRSKRPIIYVVKCDLWFVPPPYFNGLYFGLHLQIKQKYIYFCLRAQSIQSDYGADDINEYYHGIGGSMHNFPGPPAAKRQHLACFPKAAHCSKCDMKSRGCGSVSSQLTANNWH